MPLRQFLHYPQNPKVETSRRYGRVPRKSGKRPGEAGKQNQANALKNLTEAIRANKTEENQFEIPEEEDYEIQLIKKILAALNGKEYKGDGKVREKKPAEDILGLKAAWKSQHHEAQSIEMAGTFHVAGAAQAPRKKRPEMMGGLQFLPPAYGKRLRPAIPS